MYTIWLSHLWISDWPEAGEWKRYFEQAEQILGGRLTHLDAKDPIRRKVTSLEDAGAFMCAFKEGEQSRWVFGRIKSLGIEISIDRFRPEGRRFANAVTWVVPEAFLEIPENKARLRKLFDLGNRTFRPFYSFSDVVGQISNKKKPTGAVDIQAELLGVFWMTYFNSAYVAFFGKDKFDSLPGLERGTDGSITIFLGESPKKIPGDLRDSAATVLGRKSFVNPGETLGKLPGRFALTFQQLQGSDP